MPHTTKLEFHAKKVTREVPLNLLPKGSRQKELNYDNTIGRCNTTNNLHISTELLATFNPRF